jgi:hypothetical protein
MKMFLQEIISYTIMQAINIKLNDFVNEITFIGVEAKFHAFLNS